MVLSFYYLYFIISFTDCEFAAFTAGFTPSVDGNQEIVAAAFYVKCYFPVIVNYNRTYIQTVGATGVMAMVLLCGTITGPPMLSEYAVEPVGVAMTRPSA